MNERNYYDILGLTKDTFGNINDFPHYEQVDASGLPIFPADCRITTEEFKKRFAEQERLYPLHKLREKRNKLLVESDWTQFRDVVLADDEAWKTYRQALRDLPSQVEPKLNEDMDALFPTKPGQ